MLKWASLGAQLGAEMGDLWVLERGFRSLRLEAELGSEMHGFRGSNIRVWRRKCIY